MCGIVGLIGKADAVPRVLKALKRLEYRGYDSAGIAICEGETLERRRAVGNVDALSKKLEKVPLKGNTAIGHIRWATHGAASKANAHPHQSGPVAVVHNGIIENFKPLREGLAETGYEFATETDTEVVAALINNFLEKGAAPHEAVQQTLGLLEGAFALGIMICGDEGTLYAARRGSPLVVGFGDGEAALGSDTAAIASVASRAIYLEEGDFAVLTATDVRIWDENGKQVKHKAVPIKETGDPYDKGNYAHFMQKEIMDQPMALAETLGTYIDPLNGRVELPDLPFDFAKLAKLNLIACGTSYYATLAAKYWFETYARLPVETDIASEFRYRDVIAGDNELNLFISQSGETLDTLTALRHCKKENRPTAAIVNASDSTMTRETDVTFPTHAGAEIGVASTKAFTCQLAVLAALAVAAGRARGVLSSEEEEALCDSLERLPAKVADVLHHDEDIQKLSPVMAKAKNVLYIGRSSLFPIALEGALKLKEISYIHAEGYPAGEMKHGPIALVEDDVPVIVLAPSVGVHTKTFSNMSEAATRGAVVVLVSDKKGIEDHGKDTLASIKIPDANPLVLPILYAVPVQLLAYHAAVKKGTNVDQPRNLAKSVTVE